MEYSGKISNIFFIVVLLSFGGCGLGQNNDARKNNPNTDPFYVDEKGFDFNRFPLIKPYEVITLDHGAEWNLGLNDEIGFSIRVENVRKLEVNQGLIIAYGKDSTSLNNRNVYEAWFVINPTAKEEKSFATEAEFLTYLKAQGIKKPEWREVNAVFKEFLDTYCLEWIPGCKN